MKNTFQVEFNDGECKMLRRMQLESYILGRITLSRMILEDEATLMLIFIFKKQIKKRIKLLTSIIKTL